jgi:YD repeat-containing protein
MFRTDPFLGQWTYRRDKAGRIREQTDGRGNLTKFFYINPSNNQQDPLGRLRKKEVYNPAQQLASTATYSYDTGDANHTVYKGLLFQVTDSEGWEKNGYDTRGRLNKTTRHLNVNGQDYVTTYAYNDADKITTIAYPNSGPTINYEYHAGGNLYRVSRPGPYYFYTATAANFDEFGRVKVFSYANVKGSVLNIDTGLAVGNVGACRASCESNIQGRSIT